MRMSLWASLFALAFTLASNAVNGEELVTVGDPIFISNAVRNQTLSAPAYNSVDQILLVVWTDFRNQAVSGQDIFAQFLSPDSTLIGSSFPVSQVAGDQPRAGIGFSPVSNRFLVVFTSKPSAVEATDIYGQIVGGQGGLIGTNFPISTATGAQGHASIGYDLVNDRFLAVWEDSRDAANRDIYGQFVTPDGTLEGENFLISGAAKIQTDVDVAYNSASQQFLAVWADFRNKRSNGGEIFGQIIDASGTLIGANFSLVTEVGDQFRPHAAFDEVNGRFLLVWTDCRNAPTNCSDARPDGTDVFAQLLAGDATAIGSNIPIAIDLGVPQYRSLVAFNPQDQLYLTSWTDERNHATSGNDIFVQPVHSDGTLLVGNTELVDSGIELRADLVYNAASNNFLVTYTGGLTGNNTDIHGRFVTVTP